MKTIIYNKLVRDKIPEIIRNDGGIPKTEKITGKKFLHELKKKLIEESREVFNADKGSLLGELVNVLEVVQSIALEENIKWTDIERERKKKNITRGGFKKKAFLKSVEE